MGYRVKVTRANLLQAFPEKTADERLAIEKEFYKNLCDSIVETVKLCSISIEALCARIPCNSEV
jgi:KDO2-lipid IV(A) lauroyltransferase